MKTLFDPEDGVFLAGLIRRRRPRWAHNAIMDQLGIAARAGASLGQVMAAAEKAMNNPKQLTPAAIMFPENWEESKAKSAGNIAAPRLCVECTTRRDINEMTKHAHGWVCNDHEEEVK